MIKKQRLILLAGLMLVGFIRASISESKDSARSLDSGEKNNSNVMLNHVDDRGSKHIENYGVINNLIPRTLRNRIQSDYGIEKTDDPISKIEHNLDDQTASKRDKVSLESEQNELLDIISVPNNNNNKNFAESSLKNDPKNQIDSNQRSSVKFIKDSRSISDDAKTNVTENSTNLKDRKLSGPKSYRICGPRAMVKNCMWPSKNTKKKISKGKKHDLSQATRLKSKFRSHIDVSHLKSTHKDMTGLTLNSDKQNLQNQNNASTKDSLLMPKPLKLKPVVKPADNVSIFHESQEDENDDKEPITDKKNKKASKNTKKSGDKTDDDEEEAEDQDPADKGEEDEPQKSRNNTKRQNKTKKPTHEDLEEDKEALLRGDNIIDKKNSEDVQKYLIENLKCTNWDTVDKKNAHPCFKKLIDNRMYISNDCPSEYGEIGQKSASNSGGPASSPNNESNKIWTAINKFTLNMKYFMIDELKNAEKLTELKIKLLLGDTRHHNGVAANECYFKTDQIFRNHVYYIERKPFANFGYLESGIFEENVKHFGCTFKDNDIHLNDVYRYDVASMMLSRIIQLWKQCYMIDNVSKINFIFTDPFTVRLANVKNLVNICKPNEAVPSVKVKEINIDPSLIYEEHLREKDNPTENTLPSVKPKVDSKPEELDPQPTVEEVYGYQLDEELSKNLAKEPKLIAKGSEKSIKVYVDKILEIIKGIFTDNKIAYTTSSKIYDKCVDQTLADDLKNDLKDVKGVDYIKYLEKAENHLFDTLVTLSAKLNEKDKTKKNRPQIKSGCSFKTDAVSWSAAYYGDQKVRDNDDIKSKFIDYRNGCVEKSRLLGQTSDIVDSSSDYKSYESTADGMQENRRITN